MAASLGGDARAVIFVATDDTSYHTKTPGDNSGWQYEGIYGYFLGVPIGPYYFITAKHFPITPPGAPAGLYDTFNFHGDIYTIHAVHESPTADLRIVLLDPSKPFPTWAPINMVTDEASSAVTMTMIGRGTLRSSSAVIVSGDTKGWEWGASGQNARWGRNVVAGIDNYGGGYGEMLRCHFDNPGIDGECTLSTGDSGGGWFRQSADGLWRLAGISHGAESPFRYSKGGSDIYAAIYDKGGLYYKNNFGAWVLEPYTGINIPSELVASRISTVATVNWIKGIVGATYIDNLASENFSAWQRLYFSPTEIAAPASTGPVADFDGDGIKNLIEFALNLDPTFTEPVIMTEGTGFRGLPLVKRESVSGQQKVTVEFVRRTNTAGNLSGLTYTAQFSSDLVNWSDGAMPTVTPINSRWDRVKVVDTVVATSTPKRFARVKVAQ